MSKIEWTDETWNPVTGCTRASAGCDNCYAVTMTKRLEAMGQEKYAGLVNEGKSHFNGVVKCHEDALRIPMKWRKPRTVFVNSMGDLFHKEVPFEFIDRVFAVMALCPQHTFQVLTKRADRMAEYFRRDWGQIQVSWNRWGQYTMIPMPWPLPNVWLGTSVEDQAAADSRIPHLLECPAAVRFLSVEPMIGAVDASQWLNIEKLKLPFGEHWTEQIKAQSEIHWVICGGESGANARPFDIVAARELRVQCAAAGVPFFMKQLGARPLVYSPREWAIAGYDVAWDDSGENISGFLKLKSRKGGDMAEWPDNLRVRQMPERAKE